MKKEKKIFVIGGRNGVGKTTLAKELLKNIKLNSLMPMK